MKIIIIGAGIGGLQAAKLLADGGCDVTVYEKNTRENLCYDCVDDVENKVFSELLIPLPEGNFFRTADVTFIAPGSSEPMRVYVDENKRDWSVERRVFSQMLCRRAEQASARIEFSVKAESLVTNKNRVTGIIIGDRIISADLVIDSSGVFSPFRASLPESMNIQKEPAFQEIFRVYRAFFNSAPGVKTPIIDLKKIYLRHLGEDGISWCFTEPDGEINVLIGRIGELKDDALINALVKLREDNPIIGKSVIRGEGLYTIPVRYPLSRFVADGYCLIGDSAFMTIPLIGSGIANSLRAGKLLAETVLESKSCDIASLWKYQYRYYTEIGASQISVDMIKRMLLGADSEDIKFLFDNGIIGVDEFQGIASGEKLQMGASQILDKVKRGRKHLGLLIKLVNTISKGEKAEEWAKKIPCTYDEKSVLSWQRKMDMFFGN